MQKRYPVSPQYRMQWNRMHLLFQIRDFSTGLVQEDGKLLVNKRNTEIKNN